MLTLILSSSMLSPLEAAFIQFSARSDQAHATVYIYSSPAGASIYVNDKAAGITPKTLELNARVTSVQCNIFPDLCPKTIYKILLSKKGYKDYERIIGTYAGRSYRINATLVPTEPSCTGPVALTLDPSIAQPSSSVTPTASGLNNCKGKTVSFKKDSCARTTVSSCTSIAGGCAGAAFKAPAAAGNYTYFACIDKTGDGDFADVGESDSEMLSVLLPFDFVLSLATSSGTATRGNSVLTTATATLNPGAASSATTFSCTAPATISCSFSLATCNPTCSSAVTISTTASTPVGMHSVTVNVGGGGRLKTRIYTLTVNDVPITCSGNVLLGLSPLSTTPSASVTPSASGLSSCSGKTIYFKKDSCSGTQVSSCTTETAGCTGAAFNAPANPGSYNYYACVDKNGDTDFTDIGESDPETLAVAAVRLSPARFYYKWGGPEAAFDPCVFSNDQINQLVKHNEFIFEVPPGTECGRNIKNDLRDRRTLLGSALKIVRYFNMWIARYDNELDFNAGCNADGNPDCYLRTDWPAKTGKFLRGQIDAGQCGTPNLVDISDPNYKVKVNDWIATNPNNKDYDGFWFDISGWAVYMKKIREYGYGPVTGSNQCVDLSDPAYVDSGLVTNDWEHKARDKAVEYHTYIKANATAGKLHLCNADPIGRKVMWDETGGDAVNDAYLDKYLLDPPRGAGVDGCQIDGAFVGNTGNKHKKDILEFELDTMDKFTSRNKIILTKVAWGKIEDEAKRMDALEYSFASYLLGIDNDAKHAYYWGAGSFLDWENPLPVYYTTKASGERRFDTLWKNRNPYNAPIGQPVAARQRIGTGTYTWKREFTNGFVAVNGDDVSHSVTLPLGKYRDIRSNNCFSDSMTLGSTEAKILLKDVTCL